MKRQEFKPLIKTVGSGGRALAQMHAATIKGAMHSLPSFSVVKDAHDTSFQKTKRMHA
jgi:hypothetical protein